jgi:O-antigen/teichoic acid export membrane protein
LLLLGTARAWGGLYDSDRLAASIWILLPLAVVTVPRAATVELLKARYRTKEMFTVSAVFWLGSLAGLVGLAIAGRLRSAVDVLAVSCGAGLVASIWGARHLAPYVRHGRLRRTDVARLLRFGRHAFGVGASTYLFREADVWILARLMGMEMLGLYNAARIVCRFYTVGNQFLEAVVFPKASELSSRGLRSELAALYEKVVCFFMLLLVPFNSALLVFAPQLLNILYAGRFTEAAGLLRILVLGSFAWPLVAIAGNVLQATGRPALAFRVMATVLPLHWLLVIAGVHYLGLPGAPLAILISRGALAWWLNRHVAAHVGTSPARVLARTSDAWRFIVSFGKRPLTR